MGVREIQYLCLVCGTKESMNKKNVTQVKTAHHFLVLQRMCTMVAALGAIEPAQPPAEWEHKCGGKEKQKNLPP